MVRWAPDGEEEKWLVPEALPPNKPPVRDANPYTKELQSLQFQVPIRSLPLPSSLLTTQSPLRVQQWEAQLEKHPDTSFRDLVLEGVHHGFHIGYFFFFFNCIDNTQ